MSLSLQRRALAARTYLVRNPRRVIPIAMVIALVVALEIAAVTPLNAFEKTIEVYIRPLEVLTIVTPLAKSGFDEDLEATLDQNEHMDRRLPAKMLWIDTPALVGELTSPLLALGRADVEDLFVRMDLRLVGGKLPDPGTAGAVLHRAIANARGLELGDAFGRMVDPEDSTPGRFELVGLLEGPARLGVVDLTYASIPDFVLARRASFQVVYAKPGQKARSDAYLRAARTDDAEGGRPLFRVVDDTWARKLSERNLRNLPVLVGFITALDAVIVAFVVMLISVIGFQSRADEFAMHLAVGQRRGRLVKKLALESLFTTAVGWVVGLGIGLLIVVIYDRLLVQPKALVMQVVDPRPIRNSLLVPLLAAIASAAALRWKLRRMDPVAVIQRRGAG